MRCHCSAYLRGLMLCIIMTTAAAAEDIFAPPAPPSPPAPPMPMSSVPQDAQTRTDGLTLPPASFVHDGPDCPPPPHFRMDSAPQAQYCPDLASENRCHRGYGLHGSDAFASGADDEAVPQCRPLPCLVEARWRYEPLAPEFAVSSPCPPAASECSPSQGIDVPGDVRFVPAGPAPARTARHSPRRPSVPHVVPVGAAESGSPQTLTRVQHLQKAADHLEAAGHADEAQHLRERAADLQRHARQRLEELREHKRKIEEEIDELQRLTGMFDQVQIRVSILEVDEQKLKASGIDFEVPTAMKSANGAPLPPTAVPLMAFDLRPTAMAVAQLRALRESGAAKVLAEPTVVTSDGREATVFSGGEFPIAIPQGKGEIRVEWKECGVRLTATPQMLDDGRLRLDIASDVSERDFHNADIVDGYKVPRIIARRFDAQVFTRFGETLVIGGLPRQDQSPSSVARALEKMPHQKRLFRPVSGTTRETEAGCGRSMVVFVTAEPVAASGGSPVH